MATITSTPTGGTLTVNKNREVKGTISWSKPTVPSGATISSCVLTGKATASMSKDSVTITVNGTTVTSGSTFTINLGTANNTTSVNTSIKGTSNKASGSVSFSELLYTVTYTEPAAKPTYTVTFKDWDGTTLKTQTVEEGASATAPSNPSRVGYNFTGWDKSFNNITANVTITAQYSIKTYTVTFKDDDGSTLKTQTVNHGSNATAPNNPVRDGYEFTGWDRAFTNVTGDLTVTAQYSKIETPEPPSGELVEKTIALRPISVTQDSGYNNTWTNIANTYDTDTSTNGTIIVTGSSQSGFKRKYVDTIFNFDNPIPANAIINSAVLTIRAKQSATTNLNMTVSIGSDEVIGSTLLSSSSANYTADVANYVKDLNQLNINLTSAATSNRTFTLYDVRVDVNYTAYEMPEEPEGDIIEWTGLGTVASNLSSDIDHDNYKINIDWDNECFDVVITDYAFSLTDFNYSIIGELRIGDESYVIKFDSKMQLCNLHDEVIITSTEGNLPATLRFSKNGVYLLENDIIVDQTTDVNYTSNDPILFYNSTSYKGNETKFNLIVNELPKEEPEEPETPDEPEGPSSFMFNGMPINIMFLGEDKIIAIFMGDNKLF